jgi:hypothetical protein
MVMFMWPIAVTAGFDEDTATLGKTYLKILRQSARARCMALMNELCAASDLLIFARDEVAKILQLIDYEF